MLPSWSSLLRLGSLYDSAYNFAEESLKVKFTAILCNLRVPGASTEKCLTDRHSCVVGSSNNVLNVPPH